MKERDIIKAPIITEKSASLAQDKIQLHLVFHLKQIKQKSKQQLKKYLMLKLKV